MIDSPRSCMGAGVQDNKKWGHTSTDRDGFTISRETLVDSVM